MSPDEPTQRKPPVEIPNDMNAFNRTLIEEFRANRGQLSGVLASSQLMLLTTTGARSGKERTTVIGYRKDGERLVAIASGNGAPSDPAWYLNLQARPIATAEVGSDKFKVRVRDQHEVIELLPENALRQLEGAARREPFRDRSHPILHETTPLPGLIAGGRLGRLHADHLHLRIDGLGGDAGPGGATPAADWHDDHFDLGLLLEDLQRIRPDAGAH